MGNFINAAAAAAVHDIHFADRVRHLCLHCDRHHHQESQLADAFVLLYCEFLICSPWHLPFRSRFLPLRVPKNVLQKAIPTFLQVQNKPQALHRHFLTSRNKVAFNNQSFDATLFSTGQCDLMVNLKSL